MIRPPPITSARNKTRLVMLFASLFIGSPIIDNYCVSGRPGG
jgi:hypothetical protein